MITVHHLESSRSQRILWFLEEVGAEYEIKKYARNPKTMLAPPELRSVHPLGKAPIVEIDGKILVESGAILEYLAERFARLAPPRGTPEHERYRFWLHYAEGSAMPPLLLKLVFDQVRTKAPWPVRPIAAGIAGKVTSTFIGPQIRTHFDFVESELAKSTWLLGEELTAADIQMSFPIEACAARAPSPTRPKIDAFVARMKARPAFARALERGGPYGIL